jgi:hypothetical protein
MQSTLTFLLLVLAYISASAPEWVYLGLNGQNDFATAMAVSWFTANATSDYKPIVRYGNTTACTQKSTKGFTKTYNPAKGYHHTAIMTNLKPDTRYYFTCGDEVAGMSDTRNFITPGIDADELIILGDLGTMRGASTMEQLHNRVQKNLDQSRASMVLHVGDISYADDFPGIWYESVFNSWFKRMQGVMDVAPYMVCPGNHDRGCKIFPCDANNQYFKAYNARFTMLPNVTAGHSMWYSYNYGPYHIISISTETDFENAPYAEKFGDQITWLKNDLKLANANRQKHPWIIVMGHRPIYCSCVTRSWLGKPILDAKYLQTAIEDIIHDAGVDIFMAGHIHGYERIHPVYRSNVTSTDYSDVKGGVIHIVNGAGGSIEGRITVFQPGVSWSASTYLKDWGYGVMTTSSTEKTVSLTWKYHSSSDDVVRDQFTVTKPRV